jgi:hypothetical protein
MLDEVAVEVLMGSRFQKKISIFNARLKHPYASPNLGPCPMPFVQRAAMLNF